MNLFPDHDEPSIYEYLAAQLVGFVSRDARWIKNMMQINEQMFLAETDDKKDLIKTIGKESWKKRPEIASLSAIPGKPGEVGMRIKGANALDTSWSAKVVKDSIRFNEATEGSVERQTKMVEMLDNPFFLKEENVGKSRAAFWKGKYWVKDGDDYILTLNPELAKHFVVRESPTKQDYSR